METVSLRRRESLPGGGLLLTETLPSVRSVAVGVWVRTGSRDESADTSGISHFLEHMMFKGTSRRDAREIARSLDGVGGILDAYTTREYTCYFARVLDEKLELALDVLGDCLSHSRFAAEQVELEKRVVQEEIKSYEDSPEDYAAERLAAIVWDAHPLGTPILGTHESVEAFSADVVRQWYRRTYRASSMVVAATGNLRHEHVRDLVLEHLDLPRERPPSPPPPSPTAYRPFDLRIDRDLAQLTIVLGTPGLCYTDPRRPAYEIMNSLLGGSMSSRIFQRVREDEGLAYSVYSETDAYRDAGLFMCSMGVHPETGKRALRLISEEFSRLCRDGVTAEELELMKSQWKGNVVLGLESAAQRLSRLAKNELYWGRHLEVEEVLDRIDRVTAGEVVEIAREILVPERFSVVTIGPLPEGSLGRQQLAP